MRQILLNVVNFFVFGRPRGIDVIIAPMQKVVNDLNKLVEVKSAEIEKQHAEMELINDRHTAAVDKLVDDHVAHNEKLRAKITDANEITRRALALSIRYRDLLDTTALLGGAPAE